MTPREPYGIQEPTALRQQRANVCYLETITQSQPSQEVRRQSNDYRVDLAVYWPALAVLVIAFITAFVALMHFDPVGSLAAYIFEWMNK